MEANIIDEVITILENDSIQLFKLFSDKQMKASKDKCHLLISNNEKVSVKIDNIELENISTASARTFLTCIVAPLSLSFLKSNNQES